MVKFVDVPLDAGDPERAIATFNEPNVVSNVASDTKKPAQQQQTSLSDPRFAGKSPEQIAEMYRNLESHSGRLASQLGEARNSINQLILGKRENDLRSNSGKPVKVEPGDLLANPTEALDRYLEARQAPQVDALQQRLAQLESQLSQVTFTTKHTDAQTVTQDPAFAAWVRQTPLRMRLAQEAANDKYESADLLLTEWQAAKAAGTEPVVTATNRAQNLANAVSLESSNTGNDSGNGQRTSGKTYRRNDLIALRMTNPDRYEDSKFQRELINAYREGRVVD